MSDIHQRENIRIQRQPITGSREAEVMKTARAFYGSKFSEKVALILVDLLEPLHVAMATGSEQAVEEAISRSLYEIRGWHWEALNQCQNSGYISTHQNSRAENVPLEGSSDLNGMEIPNGDGQGGESS